MLVLSIIRLLKFAKKKHKHYVKQLEALFAYKFTALLVPYTSPDSHDTDINPGKLDGNRDMDKAQALLSFESGNR